jgi:hypothetical protein
LQHLRDGQEVLHLKGLGVNVTMETELCLFAYGQG